MGGLSPDHPRWIHPKYSFFLPVKVLGAVFRGKFCEGLQHLYRTKQLRCTGAASILADAKQIVTLDSRASRMPEKSPVVSPKAFAKSALAADLTHYSSFETRPSSFCGQGGPRRTAKKQSGKAKRRFPKTVLRLPDLDQAKSAVLNSLSLINAQRGYRHAIEEFVDWYCSEPRLSFSKTIVLRYRIHLESRHLAPGTDTTGEGRQEVRRPARELATAGTVPTAVEHACCSVVEEQTRSRTLGGPARLRPTTA